MRQEKGREEMQPWSSSDPHQQVVQQPVSLMGTSSLHPLLRNHPHLHPHHHDTVSSDHHHDTVSSDHHFNTGTSNQYQQFVSNNSDYSNGRQSCINGGQTYSNSGKSCINGNYLNNGGQSCINGNYLKNGGQICINSGHNFPHSQSFIMSTNSSLSSTASVPRNPFQELDPLPSDGGQVNGHQQINVPNQQVNVSNCGRGLPIADHGFPEKLYLALREIFDVLDDQKVGLLQVAEIESRWDIDEESSIFSPKGLMDCLRKVAPSDGYIDFDRFCAAIKICLLKNQSNVSNVSNNGQKTSSAQRSTGQIGNSQTVRSTNGQEKGQEKGQGNGQGNGQENGVRRKSGQAMVKSRPASVPIPSEVICEEEGKGMCEGEGKGMCEEEGKGICEEEGKGICEEESFKKGLKTCIKPNQLISVPHLHNSCNQSMVINQALISNTQLAGQLTNQLTNGGMKRVSSEIPVKPERQSVMNHSSTVPGSKSSTVPGSKSSTVPRSKTKSKGIIIKTLKSWKDSVLDKRIINPLINNHLINNHLISGKSSVKSPPPSSQEVDSHAMNGTSNSSSSDMELPTNFQPINRSFNYPANYPVNYPVNYPEPLRASLGARAGKRRERERRSTVGVTSVDYNQLKRMTLLQHEKDLLLRGLQAVDRTRDWYMKQMNLIQEKIRICGRGGFTSSSESFEVLQEKLQFKANRIIAANQHLVALMDEANFPIHMNLAFKPLLAPHSVLPFNDLDTLEAQRLQEQNHLLSADVSNKQQLINKLTKERTTLLELLQSRTPVVMNGSGTGTPLYHCNNGMMDGTTANGVNGQRMATPSKQPVGNNPPTAQQQQSNHQCFNQSNVTNYIDDSPYV